MIVNIKSTTRTYAGPFAYARAAEMHAHIAYQYHISFMNSVTEITQLQVVFTPGNERRLNKSKFNCCNYSPAHPYNNYYTLARGSSPLLAQITSQKHANHPSLLTTSIYICCNYSWLFFFFQGTKQAKQKENVAGINPPSYSL